MKRAIERRARERVRSRPSELDCIWVESLTKVFSKLAGEVSDRCRKTVSDVFRMVRESLEEEIIRGRARART